ncbi:MAG: Omp28-related outer membrane protein, partial [Bacteroidia bacterium]
LIWHQQHSLNTVFYTIHEGFGVDSMSSPFTDAIEQEFSNPNMGFAPAIMVDRVTYPWLSTEPYMTVGDVDTVITRVYTTETPRVAVDLQGTYNSANRQINATVTASFLQNVPSGNYRINIYLVEDSVIGSGFGWDQKCYDANFANLHYPGQYNSTTDLISGYPHRHVLRSALTGTWGTPGQIPNTPLLNTNYTATATYTVPANYDDSKIKLVAFVSHYAPNSSPSTIGNGNRWVLNANDVQLSPSFNTITGIQPAPSLASAHLGVFPNPSGGIVTLGINAVENIDCEIVLTNTLGEIVKIIAPRQSLLPGLFQLQMDCTELPDGVYFVLLKTNKEVITEKVIIRN